MDHPISSQPPTTSTVPVEATLPPSLQFLKWLVIVLMIVMIGGVITITYALVTRISEPNHANMTLPAAVHLPPGIEAQAITYGLDWYAIVTQDQRILIFDQAGALRQDIDITSQVSDTLE